MEENHSYPFYLPNTDGLVDTYLVFFGMGTKTKHQWVEILELHVV